MRLLRVLCLSALLSSVGCAFSSSSSSQTDKTDFTSQAESNLRLGDEAAERRDYLQAEKYYEHVRTKFPYLELANEAELKLADLDFKQEKFHEARAKYQTFIKLHPTHSKVDYAAYRAALSHFADIPSDFFILPPSSEKDQTEVLAAMRALNGFLLQYPDSSYVKEAKEKVAQVRERLAAHELYVASFYARRERWKAVVQRLEGLLERYPGTRLEEKALFNLHEAYVKLADPENARKTLERIIERLPGSAAAKRARRMLES
jgi:outer membrane protein assembly factor BamD